jgi:hypothetical protein
VQCYLSRAMEQGQGVFSASYNCNPPGCFSNCITKLTIEPACNGGIINICGMSEQVNGKQVLNHGRGPFPDDRALALEPDDPTLSSDILRNVT